MNLQKMTDLLQYLGNEGITFSCEYGSFEVTYNSGLYNIYENVNLETGEQKLLKQVRVVSWVSRVINKAIKSKEKNK